MQKIGLSLLRGRRLMACAVDYDGPISQAVNEFMIAVHKSRPDDLQAVWQYNLENKVKQVKVVNPYTMPTLSEARHYAKLLKLRNVRFTQWNSLLAPLANMEIVLNIINGKLRHFPNQIHIWRHGFIRFGIMINFNKDSIDFYAGNQVEPDPTNPFGCKICEATRGVYRYPLKEIYSTGMAIPPVNAMLDLTKPLNKLKIKY